MGAVMTKPSKIVSLHILYDVHSKYTSVSVANTAKIQFGVETNLNSILTFETQCKRVAQSYKYCVNNNIPCKLTLAICKDLIYPRRKPHAPPVPKERASFFWYLDESPKSMRALLTSKEDGTVIIDFTKPLLQELALIDI